MGAAKIVSIVVGCLVALVAIALIAGGGIMLWAHTTQRDSDGFYNTTTRNVSSSGYALTSPDVDVDIGTDVSGWLPQGVTGDIRLEAQATGNEDLFIGIGPTDQVTQYLGNVAHDEITDFGHPSPDVEYRRVEGGAPSAPPGDQDFWVVQNVGPGTQSIEWEVQDGNWTAVLMNADAASGVSADLTGGAKFGLVFPIGIGLLVIGLVLAAISVVLVYLGLRRPRPTLPPAAPPEATVPPTV